MKSLKEWNKFHTINYQPNSFMKLIPSPKHLFRLAMMCAGLTGSLPQPTIAQEASQTSESAFAELEKSLQTAKEGSSEARQRLALRRVIRDADKQIEEIGENPARWPILELTFRARQQLLALDDNKEYRQALIDIGRELAKAPDTFADLRLEADLLISQTEQAKNGASAEERAEALRPFVARYVDTPSGAKVLRVALSMALELGDTALVNDLREMVEERFSSDLEMINFQRDKLGGQVFGAPFAGSYKRSDGRNAFYPMDLLGRIAILVFWSKEDEGLDYIKGLAAASKLAQDEINGRIQFISFNLDDLPDAGESIIREAGVEWPVLHLPGGRENPVYKAYARDDPKMMRVTPTGQTALVMEGVGRERLLPDGTPDFDSLFGSALNRGWSRQEYAMQVAALMSGDFLVFDPEGQFDPTRPPELKATAPVSAVKPLKRTAGSVPEEALLAIQDAIVAPPERYRLSYPEAEVAYAELAGLCRKAIDSHPNAPDLWIVRNRLIVAHLGLWKTTGDLSEFEAAVAEARKALAAGYPEGCDLIAQFCLARAALREAGDKSGELVDQFVTDHGGGSASGPALATATLLALDIADRMRVEQSRQAILSEHTEHPMMWTFSAALLDRFHGYWMFQMPFTAGWSFGRRQGYFLNRGTIEEAERYLQAELQTDDGQTLRIPEDLDSEWTYIVFSQPAPWQKKRDDGLPSSPHRTMSSLTNFAAARPENDVHVILATFGGGIGGGIEASRAELADNRIKVECPVLSVPGGADSPIVHRLGILSEDEELNSVLIRKDGRIAGVISALNERGNRDGEPLRNVILNEDEKAIEKLLERGEVEAAKAKIMALAPPYDPAAEVNTKQKSKNRDTAHLRARAKVYMALGEWDKALADAEEVYSRTFGQSGGMSMRSEELDEAEALRDTILKSMTQNAD